MFTLKMEQCPICVDEFTEKTRKKIECPFCAYSACLLCWKRYFLSNFQDANCMNCHVEFNREFLENNLPKSFRNNDYKKHREVTLLEREKMLLPDTVQYAEVEKQNRRNKVLLNELLNKKMVLQNEMKQLDKNIRDIQYAIRGGVHVDIERRVFIKACVMDGCRGFLSTKWKCGICSTWVCKNCHEAKLNGEDDTEHVCKPENVASAKLLVKETKPCPKCAVAIYKVSGCSQMWCVQCHTTFSWETGREIVGTHIHNPHYYDWLRRNNQEIPRDPQDNAHCDEMLPNIRLVYEISRRKFHIDLKCTFVANLYRSIMHVREEEIRNLRAFDLMTMNRDLRVKYLLNDIDEEKWKSELQKREKKVEFNNAKRQVFNMFVLVGTDLMRKYVDEGERANLKNVIDEMKALVNYFNSCINHVYHRFQSTALKIYISQDNWNVGSSM